MARLYNRTGFSGTVGNITIYQMGNHSYIRKKSSLTRKRVLNDKKFVKTLQYAASMGQAAKIGSFIYKALPADIKERWLYRVITGEAASLLYQGKTVEEVQQFLWEKYIQQTGVEAEAVKNDSGKNTALSTPNTNRKLWPLFQQRWELQGLPPYYFKHAWPKYGRFDSQHFREVQRAPGRAPVVRV
jgi:hypothetical protein